MKQSDAMYFKLHCYYEAKWSNVFFVVYDGSIIFDVNLDEVEGIYKMFTFLIIKLKDNTRHFISFGIILDSSKAAASQDSADLSYRDKMVSYKATMEDWLKLFKSKGIKLKMSAVVKLIYFMAAVFVLQIILQLVLRLVF